MLVQRLGTERDLVGLEVEGPGAGADRIEPLLGGVAVLAQLLETFAPGPYRVDLGLVVLAQGVEDAVEAGALALHHQVETLEGGALVFEALAPFGGLGPLGGVALQPALHLVVAASQDAAALGRPGHPHLELLLRLDGGPAAGGQLLPGGQGLVEHRDTGGQAGSSARTSVRRCSASARAWRASVELVGQALALLGGPGAVGVGRLARGGVPVGLALGRGPGVTGPGQGDAALLQGGAGLVGHGGGLGGAGLGLLDGGGGDHAGGRADPPAGGGEAVALGGDHDQVVAGQGEVDGLLPAVDPDGVAEEGVENGLGRLLAVAGVDVGPHRLGAAAGGQVAGGGAGGPGRQHGAGDAALTQGGQGGLGRAAAVDHHRGHAGAGGGLEGGFPAGVDLDQVEQGAHHAVDLAQQLAPAGALEVVQGALERVRPGRAAVAGLLGLVHGVLRRFGPGAGRLELGGALGQGGGRASVEVWSISAVARSSRSAFTAAAWPRCSRVVTRLSSPAVSCCSRAAARSSRSVRARALVAASSGVSPPRTEAQRARRSDCSASRVAHGAGQVRALGLGRLLLGGGHGDLRGQAGGIGLEGGDHIDVGRRIEGGDHGPGPLADDARGAAGALDQPLHAAQGAGQVLLAARGQLGGGGGGLGVESLERLVQLAFLFLAHGQVLGRGAAPGGQLGQLGAGQVAPHGQQLGGHGVVRAGGCGLALQRADLAAHLADQVAQALEVLGRGGQAALGPLPAAAVLEHPGRLLDDGPAVLGPGVEHGVELALADDHVLLAAHAGVREQLLHVHQAAGRPVNGVLAVTGAEERAGDGDLGQIDGQLARRVVDGEGHLGPPEGGTRRRPGEDDVLHFGRAQGAGALGAQHPGDGIDHIGLAAPVGPDDDGDAGLELQHGGIGEGFEPLHAE